MNDPVQVRLGTVAPDLVERLSGQPVAVLMDVSRRAAGWIVNEVGVVDPRVDAALAALESRRVGPSPERAALERFVDQLDEIAWKVQEAAGGRQEAEDEYHRAFARARAVAATWFALSGNSREAALESVYEAQAATGSLADLRLLLEPLLT